MLIKRFFLAFCLLFCCASHGAQAQTLNNAVSVSFGNMIVGGTGSITIPATSNTRNSSGAVILATGGTVARGSFDITFTPGAQVLVSFPISIVMTGPNAPTFLPEILGGTVQTIPAGGTLTVYFGGTINFTTSGATGNLTALIPVQVDPY